MKNVIFNGFNGFNARNVSFDKIILNPIGIKMQRNLNKLIKLIIIIKKLIP